MPILPMASETALTSASRDVMTARNEESGSEIARVSDADGGGVAASANENVACLFAAGRWAMPIADGGAGATSRGRRVAERIDAACWRCVPFDNDDYRSSLFVFRTQFRV
jgi:hypothetical protein